jgi:hypothetical protein
MALRVTQVEVWAGDIQDQPGGLARVLSAVAGAGGSVECVIARRESGRPGTGVVFVTPVRGAAAQSAARSAGLSPAENIATLRVEGSDAPGLGARITESLAAAGINLRGVSAAVVGRNFVAYIGLDNVGDAQNAMTALRGMKTAGGGGSRRQRSGAKGSAGRRATGGAKRGGAKRGSSKKAAAKRRR